MTSRYQKDSQISCAPEELRAWHAREGAFERLGPPWQAMRVVSNEGGIEAGARVRVQLKQFGFWHDWIAEIVSSDPVKEFVDTQVEGPFAHWTHRHEFLETDSGGSRLRDSIDYSLPFGALGAAFGGRFVRSNLERAFRYRHAITKSDLEIWKRYQSEPRLRILISGGYGLIGGRLRNFLSAQGHSVSVLSRNPKPGDVRWDPAKESIDAESLDGFDVVFHLAGENLASGRWNAARKRSFWKSRVDATELLVSGLLRVSRPPRVFLTASGIGFYGDSGDRALTESDPQGGGYLADLCGAWESAANKANAFADRVIAMRTGIVLDSGGGALAKMLPPFRMGLGGALGSGAQWMPWIALEDWIGAANFLMQEGKTGAYNLCAPNPVMNRAFGKTLGRVLGRPAILDAPEFALKALIGEFAQEGLLASIRAHPERLSSEGFVFKYPNLGDALRLTLGVENLEDES